MCEIREPVTPGIRANKLRSAQDAAIFASLFKQFINEPATIEWSKMKPLNRHIDYDGLPECKATEYATVLKHLCLIKLNGGLGTTMGCTAPKSLITVRDGMTFLDFAIKQNECFNKRYECDVPLILMNSFNTEQLTANALAKSGIKLRSFTQSKCPRIFADTLLPVPSSANDRTAESWYPPGHGNIFESMQFTGILDELISQGRHICFISNIDNSGATADLRIAKFMLESNTEYAMECTEKTPADVKGGTLIEINGSLMHLELPQVPKANVEEFLSTRTFKTFNTNNIWVNLKSVKKRLSTMKMEIIVNKKKLTNGENVIQLETSVGGAIRNFERAHSIRVPRSRFLPVKKTQDLLAIMSDIYEVDSEFIVRLCPDRPIPYQPTIKLSKHFASLSEFQRRFSSIPHMADLIRLTVDGDVCFGSDVVLKGDVIIIADDGHTLEIPSCSFIENKVASGRLRFREN
ncbi:unnamed protein product [Toxocara canis]|uniref:UTP--glucose-1-phosphate uridylyltransferase n=1 Tax=Toxocara canis TaxID=6265 RepID=A0A183VD76_TOXCA|nr:unnamed protein product [Toxocara canis]